eukprot:365469-Chlamydomonas_euryale.AAC.10
MAAPADTPADARADASAGAHAAPPMRLPRQPQHVSKPKPRGYSRVITQNRTPSAGTRTASPELHYHLQHQRLLVPCPTPRRCVQAPRPHGVAGILPHFEPDRRAELSRLDAGDAQHGAHQPAAAAAAAAAATAAAEAPACGVAAAYSGSAAAAAVATASTACERAPPAQRRHAAGGGSSREVVEQRLSAVTGRVAWLKWERRGRVRRGRVGCLCGLATGVERAEGGWADAVRTVELKCVRGLRGGWKGDRNVEVGARLLMERQRQDRSLDDNRTEKQMGGKKGWMRGAGGWMDRKQRNQ